MSDNPEDHTHTFPELRRDAEIAMHQMISRCGKEIDPDLIYHSGMFFADVDKMFSIVQELAKRDPTYYHDNLHDHGDRGEMRCPYCYGKRPEPLSSFEHEADCIVTKARALVEQKERPLPAPKQEEASSPKQILKVELSLRVENNSKYVRMKSKVRQRIEDRILTEYAMDKQPNGDYTLTIEYEDDKDLERIIYTDILNEAASIADDSNCFIEYDLTALDGSERRW